MEFITLGGVVIFRERIISGERCLDGDRLIRFDSIEKIQQMGCARRQRPARRRRARDSVKDSGETAGPHRLASVNMLCNEESADAFISRRR